MKTATEKTFAIRTEVESYPVAGGTQIVVRTSVNGSTITDVACVSKRDYNFWTAVEGNADHPVATAETKRACVARYVNDCEIRHLRFAAYRRTD